MTKDKKRKKQIRYYLAHHRLDGTFDELDDYLREREKNLQDKITG